MSGNISVAGFTALAAVLVGTSSALTLGRFILHRNKSSRALCAADLLNGAAALALIALLALQCRFLPLTLALQAWALKQGPPVPRADLATYFHVEVALFALFWLVLYLAKFSVLMLYRSFFAVSRPFRTAWWAVVAFTAVSFGVDFFSTLWICGTPASLFDIQACASREAALVGHNLVLVGAALNIASDAAIMALPLGMLRGLRVSAAQKAGLALVFLLGALTVAADVARVVANFTPTVKTTFNLLEPAVAVAVCALPAYRRFLGSSGGPSGSTRWSRLVGGIRARFSSGRGSGGAASPAKELEDGLSLSDASSDGGRAASRGGGGGGALGGHAIPRAQMTGMGTYIDRYGRTQRGVSGALAVNTRGYVEYETNGALEPVVVKSERSGDMV